MLATLSHRFRKNLEAKLRCGFYRYNADSNGGEDNYQAHLVSLNCSYRF